MKPPKKYYKFKNSLPDNQRLSPEFEYPTYRYWQLSGEPENFSQAIANGMYTLEDDGYWHAGSIAYNDKTGNYEFMKPNWHRTKVYEDAEYIGNSEFRKNYRRQRGSVYDKYVPVDKSYGRINIGLPGYREGKGRDLLEAYDQFVEDDPYYIATALSYLPIIGTGMDIREAVKNPTAENIGYATLSGITDVIGGRLFAKIAGNVLKAKKVAKSVKKAELEHWRNTPFYRSMPKKQAEHTVKYYAQLAADDVLNNAGVLDIGESIRPFVGATAAYFPDFIANVTQQGKKKK